MKKPRCDAQHVPGRDAAEGHYAIEQGRSCDFGWSDVSAEESAAAVLADEISERWGGRELTPAVALEIAVRCGGQSQGNASDEVDRAIMFDHLRVVLERVVTAERPGFEAACLLVAHDVRESNHDSMRDLAKHYGVTVAAVSKRVREIADAYELPLTTFNKSAAAAAGYKLTNGRRRKS